MSIRYSPRVSSSYAGVALRLMAGARNRASLPQAGGVGAASSGRMAGGQQESLQREVADQGAAPAEPKTPQPTVVALDDPEVRRRAAERAYDYARQAIRRDGQRPLGERLDATS